MTGKNSGHATWVRTPKSAFCRDAKVTNYPPGCGNTRSISGIVIELQEPKIQVGCSGAAPIPQWSEKCAVGLFRYWNMNELDRPRHKIGDAVHQFHQHGRVFKEQQRLVSRRAVAKVKSQFDTTWDGCAEAAELFKDVLLIIPLSNRKIVFKQQYLLADIELD